MITTCGLTHIGPPEDDEFGQRGLHGRISNIPAEIESVVQPNIKAGKLEMSITAVVKQTRVFGPNLELRRTISSGLGENYIRIHDVVTNLGNEKTPHMILYHCNYGWPLVDEGAEIICKGKWKSRGLDMDNAVFNSGRNYKKCPKPLESHKAGGESCAFIDAATDRNGFCNIGLYNKKLGCAITMKYKKKQLPCLTNWQHWGPGEYVTALEPGTNFPVGQSVARKNKNLMYLGAGQSKTYDLEIKVLADEKQIKDFVKMNRDSS